MRELPFEDTEETWQSWKEVKRGKKKTKQKEKLSGFRCIHERTLSGGLGASEPLVKHDNAIKLAFNQCSPPSGEGLGRTATAK